MQPAGLLSVIVQRKTHMIVLVKMPKYQHNKIRQQRILVGLVSHLVLLQIIKKKVLQEKEGQKQWTVTVAVMMTLMWAIIVQLHCERQRKCVS
jgi:hypothetical protein